ncbi:MAG: hypothetical protein ACE364_12230 [Chlorobiota bacterium]
MMKFISNSIILLLVAITISCNKTDNYKSQEVEVNTKNIIDSTKNDIEQLAKYLDFTTYTPYKVEYKLVKLYESGQNDIYSTFAKNPEYKIEALMYFDSVTMEKFYEFDRNADYPDPNYNIREFNFEWLSSEIENELLSSNDNYHGHPDFFFRKDGNCKSWYLRNKILIKNF